MMKNVETRTAESYLNAFHQCSHITGGRTAFCGAEQSQWSPWIREYLFPCLRVQLYCCNETMQTCTTTSFASASPSGPGMVDLGQEGRYDTVLFQASTPLSMPWFPSHSLLVHNHTCSLLDVTARLRKMAHHFCDHHKPRCTAGT